MGIQTEVTDRFRTPDLVHDVYLSFTPLTGGLDHYSFTLYAASSALEPLVGKNTEVFHCSGAWDEEGKATLAFLDICLGGAGYGLVPPFTQRMATWDFTSKTNHILQRSSRHTMDKRPKNRFNSYISIRYKIRHQGLWKSISESKNWAYFRSTTGDPSPVVLETLADRKQDAILMKSPGPPYV